MYAFGHKQDHGVHRHMYAWMYVLTCFDIYTQENEGPDLHKQKMNSLKNKARFNFSLPAKVTPL